MKFEDVEIRKVYEYRMGKKLVPVHITDKHTHRIIGDNLDTGREIVIYDFRKIVREIENIAEWRLHNGENSIPK
mgnify:CR=1 FL=1